MPLTSRGTSSPWDVYLQIKTQSFLFDARFQRQRISSILISAVGFSHSEKNLSTKCHHVTQSKNPHRTARTAVGFLGNAHEWYSRIQDRLSITTFKCLLHFSASSLSLGSEACASPSTPEQRDQCFAVSCGAGAAQLPHHHGLGTRVYSALLHLLPAPDPGEANQTHSPSNFSTIRHSLAIKPIFTWS